MTRRQSGPVGIGDALQGFLQKSDLGDKLEQAKVVPEWEERVGQGIAEVTRPLRVSDGTLVVAVRSSAWLMELKMMQSEILRRLNAGRGAGRVEGIRFVMDEAPRSGADGGR